MNRHPYSAKFSFWGPLIREFAVARHEATVNKACKGFAR